MEKSFRFGAEIIKSTQDENGNWIFEGIASLPGEDLQGEETIPNGLEIDYLLGKGLPPGAGGFINYDHDATIIIGVPLDGKVTAKGFWLKWEALKTPFMKKIIEQMKAMKDAGWPRRYGMSIEGVVKERDPDHPNVIRRAFIRNVALTPTPVHPGTFVDFAKSLSANTILEYQPIDMRKVAIEGWVNHVASISTGQAVIKSNNPYFTSNGIFKRDQDVPYFMDVHGLPEQQAIGCARYALSRQDDIKKSLVEFNRSRGHPPKVIRDHLREFKQKHPDCPHVTEDGTMQGGMRDAARHFYGCERRKSTEVNAILELLKGSGILSKED